MISLESNYWRKIVGLENRCNSVSPVFIYFVRLAGIKQLFYLQSI